MLHDKSPTLIASAVTAYYHTPAVWCENEPSDVEWMRASERELIQDVYRVNMNEGLRVRVRRDGLFVFDFTKYSKAPETEIPGYISEEGKAIPKAVTKAEKLAEERAHYRTMLINVHQACISSAHNYVHRRATPLNRLVYPTDLITLSSFEVNSNGSFHLPNDPFQRYLITQTTLTPEFRITHPEIRSRRLLELDTIEYSFVLFARIIRHDFSELALLIEMLFRAAKYYSHNHPADCLIACWTVCERLLNYLWEEYLKEKNSEQDGVRINRSRKEKLTGRDFTASIISENLELMGRIPTDLFHKIDAMRKARNKRLHDLTSVKDKEASSAIRTAEEFIELLTGVKISLCISRTIPGTGGIPKDLLESQRQFENEYQITMNKKA